MKYLSVLDKDRYFRHVIFVEMGRQSPKRLVSCTYGCRPRSTACQIVSNVVILSRQAFIYITVNRVAHRCEIIFKPKPEHVASSDVDAQPLGCKGLQH